MVQYYLLSRGLNLFINKGTAPTTKGSTVVSYVSENVTVPCSHSLETFVFVWERNIVIGCVKIDMLLVSRSAPTGQTVSPQSQPANSEGKQDVSRENSAVDFSKVRPTTGPAVYPRPLIAGHITSAVYLTKVGLHVKWSPCPGKATGV